MTETPHSNSSFRRILFIFGLIVPVAYIGGILALSLLSNVSFNDVIVYKYFPTGYLFPHLVNYLIKPLTIMSGLLLIMCFPGIFFTHIFIKEKSNFSYTKLFSLGFILNISLLVLGTTLIKLFGIAIDRFWFVAVILVLTLVGAATSSKSKTFFSDFKVSEHKSAICCFFLLFFVLISFIIVFHDSVLRPLPVDFEYSEKAILGMDFTRIGDPQEEFGVVYHLKDKILPYWLINSLNEFGVFIYWPHLSYFLNFFAITLFGESYAAFNLLSLVFVLCAFLFTYKILYINKSNIRHTPICIILALFMLNFLILLMKSIRRPELPFIAWPENSLWATINCLWVFLMMGFIFFLLKKDPVLTSVYASMSIFCRYESIPCIFVLLIIHHYLFKESRLFLKKFLKFYIIFLALFAVYLFILCTSHKAGSQYFLELAHNKIFIRFEFTRNFISNNLNFNTTEEIIWRHFNWQVTWEFMKVSLVSSYFFIFLFFVPSRDKIVNFLSIFGLVYFVSVIVQSHKLSTYALLMIPLSCIGLRRYMQSSAG